MRPTVRADLKVSETYVYTEEPPLDCPITAFGGLADPTLLREEIDAWRHLDARSVPDPHAAPAATSSSRWRPT